MNEHQHRLELMSHPIPIHPNFLPCKGKKGKVVPNLTEQHAKRKEQ